MDLHGQLPCRCEYQRTRLHRLTAARHGVRQQMIKSGKQKSGGLARAGLCLTGDVAPVERQRQRLRLDRRTNNKTCLGYASL